jgi:hypothetical protein
MAKAKDSKGEAPAAEDLSEVEREVLHAEYKALCQQSNTIAARISVLRAELSRRDNAAAALERAAKAAAEKEGPQ